MALLKQRVPDESALRRQIAGVGDVMFLEVQAVVGALEVAYLRQRGLQKRLYVCLAGLFIAVSTTNFLIAFPLSSHSFYATTTGALSPLIIFLLIVIGVVSFVQLVRGRNVVAEFNTKLDTVVLQHVFSVLGVSGALVEKTIAPPTSQIGSFSLFSQTVTKNTPLSFSVSKQWSSNPFPSKEEEILRDIFSDSELVTEPHNQVTLDAMITIDVGDKKLFAGEYDIKNVTGSGRNRSVKDIFTGYFITLELDRLLEGKTFISASNDTSGFGHQTFWTGIVGGEVKETTLEWNDFNELLHVATNNETEARVVLTPNFMQSLYDWWITKKEPIRISFVGNHLYMLFPDRKIRFNTTVEALSQHEIEEYAFTIAKPLLHVLHLAEDVKV